MGAYKFETFVLDRPGNVATPQAVEELERARNEAYARGFKDGVNATKTALDVEHNKRLASIDEALQDLHITHNEASASILRSLAPTMEAFLLKLTPSLARDGITQQIITRIDDAVRKSMSASLHIHTASAENERLMAELENRAINVEIVETDELEPGVVELHWAGGVDQISLQRLIDDVSDLITTQLAAYTKEEDDAERHTG
jgi:hypothetical protein